MKFIRSIVCFGIDDDEIVSEKKSHSNKKSVSQQASIERADSLTDHSLLTPTRTMPQEFLTPIQLDQFAPHIPVGKSCSLFDDYYPMDSSKQLMSHSVSMKCPPCPIL